MGERQVTLRQGEATVFAPGQDHVLLDHSQDFELFVAALTPDLAERALGSRAVLPATTLHLAAHEFGRSVEQLQALERSGDAETVEHRLGELFARTIAAGPRGHVLSRRAVQTMLAEPAISEAELAARLHTVASGLSRQFRRDLGLTLVEHRARLRLIAFIAAVEDGASMTRAALAAGFGSYAQCHRVFRRLLEQSPRDYFSGGRALIENTTVDG